MGIFDRFRSSGRTSAKSGGSDSSEQDAMRLIDEGNTLEAENRIKEAKQRYLDAMRMAPTLARAHLNHGNVLLATGDLEGALNAFNTAIKHKPDYAGAYYNIGNALRDNGQFKEAVASYREALKINPEYAEVHCALGIALYGLSLIEEAAACQQRALEINPNLVEAYVNLGMALHLLGQFNAAAASHRRALELNPDLTEAHCNLGNIMKDLGLFDDALTSYRRALEINPSLNGISSNLLFTLNYIDSFTPTYYLEQARKFGRMVSEKAVGRFSAWQCVKMPKRLRVGLVSGDLRIHPAGFFLQGLLSHIDPARIELIAYPTNHYSDELTARIKPYFSEWKPLAGKSDEDAARMIHADDVHILLDLSGHTAYNQLAVFAWKPAPVQVSWLGYFATTGVAEMDYLLADEMGVPETQRQQFTESIWYLPDTRLCFTAPEVDLPVTPLPVLSNGIITFGCFQNLPKVCDAVLAAWGEIFAALPDARLRMQCRQLDEPAQREQLAQRLQRHGINPARVTMYGLFQRKEYLAAHDEVDLILDTFPYPGGTTTCEALWMGVPTLTLAGDSLLERQGASLLSAAGLKEWIAASKEEYIAKAIAKAGDKVGLSTLRVGLRQQVLTSPLFDAPRFALNFEDALWGMWKDYQSTQ